MTKVLILESVVSSDFSYSRGSKQNLSDTAAAALINAGFALRLVEVDLSDDISTAAESAGYTLMAAPSGTVPAGGGYYFGDDDRLRLIHPSGARCVIDPLGLTPGWSP